MCWINPVCWANSILEGFTEQMGGMIDPIVTNSFSGSAGLIGADQFNVATALAGKFIPVMFIVTFIVTLWTIARESWNLRPDLVLVAVAKGVIAWPLTMAMIWLAITVTHQIDKVAVSLIGNNFNSSGMLFAVGKSQVSPIGNPVFVIFIVALFMLLLAFVLSIIMIFRNLTVLALIAFAPVSWMVISGGESGKKMASTWVEAFVAALLIKPVAAGMLVLSNNIAASAAGNWSGDTNFSVLFMGLAALVLACMSPKLTREFVSFLPTDRGDNSAGDRAVSMGGRGVRSASRGVRNFRKARKAASL